MYRRELLILTVFALLAFCLVAVGTTLLVNRLNARVISIATGTIPDLANSGAFRGRILENWNRVLIIQASNSPEERSRLIAEIHSNSTVPLLQAFRATPNTPEQEVHFQRLEALRLRFFHIRNDYFVRVQNGQMKEAGDLMESQLKPAYTIYREEAETLSKITADEGYARARDVMKVAHFSVLVAGVLAACSFLAGVIVGFRILFQGLAFANKFGQLPKPTNLI